MQAAWEHFDEASVTVAMPLTKGPRGRGRERDQLVRHVYASERHNWWRKVGIREDDAVRLTPQQLGALRKRYVAAIREYHAEGRLARRWPLRFLIRRTTQHALDHAWELEDRDPARHVAKGHSDVIATRLLPELDDHRRRQFDPMHVEATGGRRNCEALSTDAEF